MGKNGKPNRRSRSGSAIKRVEQSGTEKSLVDGEGRGTGRCVWSLKPMPTRVTADWMAQQWRDGKRLKKKLGSYPSMSLGKAREVFAATSPT